MKTFNILGCCILRDIFRINECSKEKYAVKKFIQFCNPISMVNTQNALNITEEDLNDFDWSGFCKRCFSFDNNKTVFSTIGQNPTDYLLLDLSELRFGNYLIKKLDGSVYVTTYTKYQKEFIEKSEKQNEILSMEEKFFSDAEIFEVLDKYADELKSLYDEKKMIIVENRPATQYLDYNEKEIKTFVFHQYYNPIHMMNFYKYFEAKLPNAIIIKVPNNFYATSKHLWGVDPLHFENEYYEYLYKAMKICLNGYNEQQLSNLYKDYESLNDIRNQKTALEFYIAGKSKRIVDCDCFDLKNGLWSISKSKHAGYDSAKYHLITGNENSNFCILRYNLDLSQYQNKRLTLSVKYKTEGVSILNMIIRKGVNDNGVQRYDYSLNKRFSSYGKVQISDVTYDIGTIDDNESYDICLYINRQNESAFIYRVVLEEGETSSLLW